MCQPAPTPPPAPDYVGAANAQGAANLTAGQQTASLSNPNINTPYGSQTVSYDTTGPNGDYQPTINQTLTPEAQATLSSQQAVQRALAGLGQQGIGQAQQILGQPCQYRGPGLQTSTGQPGSLNYGPSAGQYGLASGVGAGPSAQTNLDLSNVAKMPVNAGTTGQQAILSRLQPQIQQNEQATAQRLANQGIPQGSEAWNNAMREQGNQENDLYTQAALQGIGLDTQANQQGYNQGLGQNFGQNLSANQSQNQAIGQNYGQGATSAGLYNTAQGQGFNQNLQGAQFGNTAAQQAYAQALQQYNQPLNEITALMSGSQIQNPQFQGYTGSNIQAAPIANATAQQGQFAQNLYGQQVAQYNAGQQALGGLLGAGLGMFSFGA